MVERNIEGIILQELNEKGSIEDSAKYSAHLSIDHPDLVGQLKSLAMDEYVILSQLEKKQWILTKEGLEYVSLGTPEYRLFSLIPSEGILKDQLTVNLSIKWGFYNIK